MVLQHALLAFSIAAILAPFSYYAGLGAKHLRLPQITGYLLSGIICGPYVLSILSRESVRDLNVIEGVCLSIIGLAAGAELDAASLSRSKRQVLGITAAICAASWILCYVAFDSMASVWSILPSPTVELADPSAAGSPGSTASEAVLAHAAAALAVRRREAVATLGATLMMTRSPASAIAVLKEVDGKGPFSSLVMAVVVVKDVVVIMAYALNMELIRAVILPANVSAEVQMLNLLIPLLSVILSMAVGAFGGLLLGVLLRPRPPQLLPSSSHGHAREAGTEHGIQHIRYKQALVLCVASSVFAIAHYFDAEPLLACVTMGMLLANRRGEKGERDHNKEELHHLLSSIMALTNVAFFGLAGASLKLSALKDMLVPALVVAAVRMASIYVGSWLGCYASGTSADTRRVFWASMITQAGVALGLARLAGTRFPDWGPHFQTYMMAIILINLLVGPPLFRWSLVRTGEARPHGPGVIALAGPGSMRQSSTGLTVGVAAGSVLAGAKAAFEAAAQDVVGESVLPSSNSHSQ